MLGAGWAAMPLAPGEAISPDDVAIGLASALALASVFAAFSDFEQALSRTAAATKKAATVNDSLRILCNPPGAHMGSGALLFLVPEMRTRFIADAIRTL
jgi:hypothetical protein